MHFFYPTELPIYSCRTDISELLANNQVSIIAGDTGSGKTTQLPKICLETFPDMEHMIGCTQPRRVAATTVADRVREELGNYGGIVGCKIRFLDQTTRNTRIKFMTDGVLLAETKQDPFLKKYDLIIIDEAHERNLNIDFLLGYLKNLIGKRPDLKLVITSATIDTELFSCHFENAPVYHIEGRSYPVDIVYKELSDQDKNFSYLDHCIEIVSDVASNWPPGDLLVFMPTEKDIRECVEILHGRLPNHTVMPLFGRMQRSDQQKIFNHRNGYKVVIATNVAETSVTVPGIRYVIDTGLARISSYNTRSRTTGLPVTRISQASCNQRAGRCGRIGPGTCLRLYSEDDYRLRPEYSIPEIKRSNLAEVILQMISLNLGKPNDFPFLDPPLPAAVRDGYRVLQELGAISRSGNLSKDGRLMARLPIDPVIAKVIIVASKNNCLKEIIIIAAALAIQDPRIRPADQEKKADEAHKRFTHPHSDFMVLLSIWNDFHSGDTGFSWSRLKRFCKQNYLSFQRMREWLDLHDQLTRIVGSHKSFLLDHPKGSYEQIHRSLLSGLFRQCARRKKGNSYTGANSNEIMIFPGSHQFSKSGDWIIAGSFIETSRHYAMTIATIEPEWIEDAATDFCSFSWSNIRWQKKKGQVVADESVSLNGLVIIGGRMINYGKRDSRNIPEARSIFIQKGLVENRVDVDLKFHKHNLNLIKKWQDAENRLRKRDIVIQDDVIYFFYEKNLATDIYDCSTLIKYLKKNTVPELFMSSKDILLRQPSDNELFEYPPDFDTSFGTIQLSYCFEPGEIQDGVTAHIPLTFLDSCKPALFEWLVPGLLKEKTTFLVKGLPKKIRKHLVPVNRSVDQILDNLITYRGNYYRQLSGAIFKLFRISINRSDWPEPLPEHLQMRFSVHDNDGKEHAAGRDLTLLKSQLHHAVPQQSGSSISNKDKDYISNQEKLLHTSPDFDSIPARIPLVTSQKKPVGYLFAAVQKVPDRQGVRIVYVDSESKAMAINSKGIRYLIQLQVREQHKQLKKYCKISCTGPSTTWLTSYCGGTGEMNTAVIDFVQKTLFGSFETPLLVTRQEFDQTVQTVKIRGYYKSGTVIIDQILHILRQRKELLGQIIKYERLSEKTGSQNRSVYQDIYHQLDRILPENFLAGYSNDQLPAITRYLKGIGIRIQRAYTNPAKDIQKQRQIEPHLDNEINFLEKCPNLDDEAQELLRRYSQLIAEYHVSLFSPEMKTVISISEKKLTTFWKHLRSLY